MRLLVTGAKGMLGHRVAEAARERGHEVYVSDLPELDLTDAQAVFDHIGDLEPEAVIHCAAYTDVDGAEADEDLALRINMEAAGNVAAASGLNGAFVVAMSTDYVFPGDQDRPYVESDEPAPQGAYGRTKMLGERAVQDVGTDSAIVRTAWLFGAGGKNFVDTMLALADENDEVRVVSDQVGSPTWTGFLAPRIVEIAERRIGGIHHLAGTGQCSWADLAAEVFRRAGVDCSVVPVTSAEFPRPAPRPAWSVLGSERDDALTLPAWTEHVAAYLEERQGS
ncbi:MAG: dTDP-4-dehydrorhamnose reductase [Solirubrobacteraceae bacterium]|nr:dTDP-4-dehydrorhamnose reductase [Solirubrobacteraceae bacterium]